LDLRLKTHNCNFVSDRHIWTDRETDRQTEVLLTVTSEAIKDPDTSVSNITDAVSFKYGLLYRRVVTLYNLTIVIAVQCKAEVIQVCNRHTKHILNDTSNSKRV